MANIPNTPAELPGTSSTVSPAGAILPWYRPGNYYPNPLRAQGPGGIQSGASANPAYPPQTGMAGGNGGSYSATAMAAQTNGGGNGGTAPVGAAGAGNAVTTQPFSFTQSPVPVLLIMLVASVLLLRFVHYGY